MTQAELVMRVAHLSGTSEDVSSKVLTAFGGVLGEQLCVGNTVEHRAIGKFSPADRAAREGRNPATGEAIEIAASRKVKFKAAKALRVALNPPRRASGG